MLKDDNEEDDAEFFQRMFSGVQKIDLYTSNNNESALELINQPSKNIKQPKGTFVGTPVYQAPEMIVNNTGGPFSDLWALGVIIYQMITG